MRDVNPRLFNKMIFVELPATTVDATTHEGTVTWTTLCKRRASIDPMQGRELHQAKAVEADLTHRIRMYCDRLMATVTPRHRLRYEDPIRGTRYFNIISIRNIEERNRLLEISAMEQTE